MNYLLRQIADICHDSPDGTKVGHLSDFDSWIKEYEEGYERILRLAHELQGILDGEPHLHVAGTLADLEIDACAVCGADIRHPVHKAEP